MNFVSLWKTCYMSVFSSRLGPACGLQGLQKLVKILAAFPSLQHLEWVPLKINFANISSQQPLRMEALLFPRNILFANKPPCLMTKLNSRNIPRRYQQPKSWHSPSSLQTPGAGLLSPFLGCSWLGKGSVQSPWLPPSCPSTAQLPAVTSVFTAAPEPPSQTNPLLVLSFFTLKTSVPAVVSVVPWHLWEGYWVLRGPLALHSPLAICLCCSWPFHGISGKQ